MRPSNFCAYNDIITMGSYINAKVGGHTWQKRIRNANYYDAKILRAFPLFSLSLPEYPHEASFSLFVL